MEVVRKKPYKAKSPQDTINEIRNILHGIGILMKEEHFKDKNSLFHSCRIVICNNGLDKFNLGCNGKGMTAEYALASAYGEFMERLQNNLIFMHQDFAKIKFLDGIKKDSLFYKKMANSLLSLKYNYFPDESYTQSSSENKQVINKYISNPENYYNGLAKDERLTLLPFYNVFQDKIERLPIELIIHNCTSNGMSAGNTSKEAIIQGLSEILERYVTRLIYKDNLCLPNIPKEYFKGNKIYDNIILLEQETGLTIDIKDCSCGINIPAIGVLLLDKINEKYQFHIGVDPSPLTALERSLTEIYQGRSDILFHNIDIDYQSRLLNDFDLKEKEMFKTYVDSRGIYPISLLSDIPNYSFKGFNNDLGVSDDHDLDSLIDIVRKLGYNIYIRDTSFLNFPSYHIFIPGMSEIKNVFSYKHFNRQYRKTRNYFLTAHDLPHASGKEIGELLEYMKWEEKNLNVMRFFNDNDALVEKDSDLITAVLNIKIGKKHEAVESINKYIERIYTVEGKLFFKCVRDILLIEINNIKMKLIEKLYPSELIEKALIFLEQKNILSFFNFSTCFNCEICKIKEDCSFFDVLKIAKDVELEYEKHIPNQTNISKLFNINSSVSF